MRIWVGNFILIRILLKFCLNITDQFNGDYFSRKVRQRFF